MEWTTADIPRGLQDADRAFRSGQFVIALWDHEKCRGWQLYAFKKQVTNSAKLKWVAGAGADSIRWSVAEAKHWAEELITNV